MSCQNLRLISGQVDPWDGTGHVLKVSANSVVFYGDKKEETTGIGGVGPGFRIVLQCD